MCKLSSVGEQTAEKPAPTSRRARLRAETTREIKAIALRHVAEGGPDAISLRAIARDMGMTAGAIYSYFATRDDLVTTLINDLYASLMDTLDAALAAAPPGDPAARILAWGQAFRTWSLANREGFRLIYGDGVSGYQVPEGGAAPELEHRACTVLTGLVADAWPHAAPAHADDTYTWDDIGPALATAARAEYPELPPAAVALALRVWGRTHGLVSLEVYGHLTHQIHDPARLYRAELCDLIRSLGLTPPRT
ncbi:MAG: TetR/AcrR family transcriptional regulator [Streptomycetaceae bacterium]|nr:TetR/AcrR family transcriptional regulator [Streptomycetaceae bacterium]